MSILGGIAGNLAGGSIGRAVVSLVLDTTGYNAQLEKTQATTAASTNSMQKSTTGFAANATAIYAVAGAAVAAFAVSSVKAAIEHEQAIAALTAQVGDNTQAFEEQATALQNVSGFQDEAILGADTILSRYKLTQEQVMATIPSLLDLARVQGITVPEAATQFGKAVLGNTRALKALGVGSEEFVVTGNRAQDAARLVEIFNSKIGGQAAAFADTYAGKMEILSAKFDDMKEAVGGQLLPALTDLADAFIEIGNIMDVLGDKVPGIGTALDAAFSFPGLTLITDNIHKWAEVLGVGADESDGLTVATQATTDAMTGMSQTAYDAAAASHELSKAQTELSDAVDTAGEGILSLTTTVKDTFDISQKELQRGFNQMLQTALRFKSDMKQLDNLDIGLSPNAQARFETFMLQQGPGYIDAFVNASAAKQARMVAQWSQSVNAMQAKINSLHSPTVQVNLSTAAADASLNRLKSQLARLS